MYTCKAFVSFHYTLLFETTTKSWFFMTTERVEEKNVCTYKDVYVLRIINCSFAVTKIFIEKVTDQFTVKRKMSFAALRDYNGLDYTGYMGRCAARQGLTFPFSWEELTWEFPDLPCKTVERSPSEDEESVLVMEIVPLPEKPSGRSTLEVDDFYVVALPANKKAKKTRSMKQRLARVLARVFNRHQKY